MPALIVRLLLLVMVGIATICISVYCDMLIAQQFIHLGMGRTAAGVCAAILTVIVLGVALAMPIQVLFPRHPLIAAGAIGWMPLALKLLLTNLSVPLLPAARLFGIICAGTAAWGAMVTCAWLVGRMRHKG